ncbi:MAG: response regulator [Rhodocyclaceae bacterium]|nr:response regulator [Rhodocyclaceae bacterium]MBX3667827.1 response regulator [Rhodocyclaceae bacterium]
MKNQRLLLVEDEEILSFIIDNALSEQGYEVHTEPDGQAAWERLSGGDTNFATIILDREMPRMNGITLLRNIKATPAIADVPVVIETGTSDAASVREGLDAGAYYYLTKPLQIELLQTIVRAAVEQFNQRRDMRQSMGEAERAYTFLEQGRLCFRSVTEASLLARLCARACAEPEKAAHGLQELLVNAVEHGNLGIRYADKTQLVLAGNWQDEVARRLALPEFRERRVEIQVMREGPNICFTIRDEGEGFDWQRYLEFDPARAFDPHGRGIAMARLMSFDRLQYQGRGNVVVAVTRAAT